MTFYGVSQIKLIPDIFTPLRSRIIQMKLIHKGGFRERANRERKYQQSENQRTSLDIKRPYQPRQAHDDVEQGLKTEQPESLIPTASHPAR